MNKNLFTGFMFSIMAFSFYPAAVQAQSYITYQPPHCDYSFEDGETPEYSYEYIGAKRNLQFKPGERHEITIYIRNTGNIPFFSAKSGCAFRAATRLGTTRELDRESPLYAEPIEEETGWNAPNRIELDQKRVDPGEEGTFTFTIEAPEEEGIYREYFDIVIEGKMWLQNDFVMNFDVGEFLIENRENLYYVDESRLIKKENLQGEKSIEVDISEQRMRLRVGDIVIREFPVSTGTWRTPTPYGHTHVLYKQEVRVAAKWPHYIMPKWIAFRAGGYGIHALPSIAFDNGYYWREALSHIGQRRSHGCIRLLPRDAEFAYDFTEVGTAVWVHP